MDNRVPWWGWLLIVLSVSGFLLVVAVVWAVLPASHDAITTIAWLTFTAIIWCIFL